MYFGRVIQNREEYWVPDNVCKSCDSNLNLWWNGTRLQMPFAVPTIWKKPRNHRNDCYFCLTNVVGFSAKNKHKINYANCTSVMKPVPHDDNFPVPTTPKQIAIETVIDHSTASKSTSNESAYEESSVDPDYVPEDEPHFLDQAELNDLIRDLGLTKEKSELLASRMLQWNLLKSETKVTFYGDRNNELAKFFLKEKLLLCGHRWPYGISRI